MSSIRRTYRILLIEDNLGDIRLSQEALKECGFLHELTIARHGVEAMACLRREGSYAHVERPDLILLDLNLPKVDGREVLSQVKSDHSLRRIPVIVLTTSRSEDDITKCYDLHANAYIAKPLDMDAFISVMTAIHSFWFGAVLLPPTL